MGISGLLPLLKSIQVNKHLSDFAGQTLAVDAYVWLHRGVYGCATELATGKKTTKHVDYAMHRLRLLRHHKIQPYVVFDGGPLPAKKGTESERKQRREDNLAKANTLASQGKHSQAREFYVKCVDVTPQMAYQLIKVLRAEGIQYVVAPYEADAQMAYLERIGIVDGIITEDSDLLVFGCRKVLFKLDSVSSTITSISRDDFGSVTTTDAGISLLGWTDSQFRAMAILSGCDYLPSIPGVGLKTAWTLLRKHRTVDQLVRALRLEGKKSVPKGYLEAFNLAEKVFLHQRVYCPLDEKLVCLTEITGEYVMDNETGAYIGRW
ncbi:PIN domain-like protein [Boletus edulis]|nr:PIN domain-like protein [Boletus edulis]